MSVWKRSDEHLTPLEAIAANLLAKLYVERVGRCVNRQIEEGRASHLVMYFDEPEQMPIVVQALEAAQDLLVTEVWGVVDTYCSATKSNTKEGKIAARIADDIRSLSPKWR